MDSTGTKRVEVTSGVYSDSGKLRYPTKDAAKFDLLAVCLPGGGIVYSPPFSTTTTPNERE
jgi:hypothetical protein